MNRTDIASWSETVAQTPETELTGVFIPEDFAKRLYKAMNAYEKAVNEFSLKARAVTEDRNLAAGEVYQARQNLLAMLAGLPA